MDEKFVKILAGAGDVFMRFGIRSVTMDDIARELKVSKKTLYKYVSDKSDLVMKVMSTHCEVEQCTIKVLVDEATNAIDEIVKISDFVGTALTKVHPSIHYDLQKYYPEAWGLFHEHKQGFVLHCIENNLIRGMEEGLYRDNLDPRIISRLYVAKMDVVFDPEVFPTRSFSFYQVYLEWMRYHVRGIASPKGLKYLQEIVSKGLSNF